LIQRIHPNTGAYQSWSSPQEIGSIALCESGRILVALQNNLQFLDTSTALFSHFIDIQHPAERMRLNDGRTDKAGRLCLGSLVLGRHENHGVLYQIDNAGMVKVLDKGFCVSNTTCFSPDGRWLYFADSLARQIWRYTYDVASGQVGPRELFIDTQPFNSGPDGATVDSEGRLWVAMVLSGQVVCFSSDGQLVQSIQVPVPYPTCPSFGGPDLSTLYVTSIRDSGNLLKSNDPNSGALISIKGLDARGLPEVLFADGHLPHKAHRTIQEEN
jgi:sugar lactone lactonase YvrE